MTVSCKMNQCPYHDRGFCAKPGAVNIDQMGMCSVLWRKGQQRALFKEFYAIIKEQIGNNLVNKQEGYDLIIQN